MSDALKGTAFEIEVTVKLMAIEGVNVLSNLWVYSETLDKPTEIDRLIIAPWGLYCVEVKSFNSALIGTFNERMWVGRSWKRSTKIYSPVFQNFEHIRSLNNNLRKRKQKPLKMQNIVVVPDSCKIMHDTNMVMGLSQFCDKLLSDSIIYNKSVNVKEILSSLRKVVKNR